MDRSMSGKVRIRGRKSGSMSKCWIAVLKFTCRRTRILLDSRRRQRGACNHISSSPMVSSLLTYVIRRNATVQKHHEAETTANAETEDSPPQLWALLIQCSGCQ